MDLRRLPAGLAPGGRVAAWRPERPRLVLADVDGTLVSTDRFPTPAVEDAVARVQAAGIAFGIASGRMRLAVAPLWERLRASGPHVVHNGAEIWHAGSSVEVWPIAPDIVTEVLAHSRKHGWYAEVYVEAGYFVTDRREVARPHWEMLALDPLGLADELDPSDPVLKITFGLFGGEDPSDLLVQLHALGLEAGPATAPRTPSIGYVNATSRDADKGRAVTHVARHLGIDLAGVVAIGDGHNDRSMLEVAGTAIAMADAPEEILAVAHLVVPGVADDGVVHALDACLAWPP